MKPRLLDLFCGAGGCTRGYQEAGFEVVGVDLHPQPNYCGESFHRTDALAALESMLGHQARGEGLTNPFWGGRPIDAIHASPPCQAHSAATGEHRDKHPELIAPTRELLQATGLPYVIENVERSPLINPVRLCGSSFGLPLRRHRLFETNFPLMAPPCAHGAQEKRFDIYEHGKWRKSAAPAIYGKGGGKAGEHWGSALGIDWMTRDEMAQAIPPAFTAHIGSYLLAHIEAKQKAAA